MYGYYDFLYLKGNDVWDLKIGDISIKKFGVNFCFVSNRFFGENLWVWMVLINGDFILIVEFLENEGFIFVVSIFVIIWDKIWGNEWCVLLFFCNSEDDIDKYWFYMFYLSYEFYV